jgi:hypothetical protein
LLGYPVLHSYEMPVYTASPSTQGAWLFGDFNSFATIGDRGDSNIKIKVLDQVAALNGQTVILGYRRTDQRVVLQEAVLQHPYGSIVACVLRNWSRLLLCAYRDAPCIDHGNVQGCRTHSLHTC